MSEAFLLHNSPGVFLFSLGLVFTQKKVQLQLFKNLVNLHFIEQHNRDNILNV